MKKALCVLALTAIFSTIDATQGESQMSEFQQQNELKYGSKQISVGSISATYSENVKLYPDTAEFSITYLTEGATPNNASNRNIKNMGEFQKYLKSLGLKESDITTTDYRNYENSFYNDEEQELFKSILTITFNMERDKFYNIIKLLEKNGVTNLQKDEYKGYYYFTIDSVNSSESEARKSVQERFENIEKLLKSNSVSNIDIQKYNTEIADKERENIKKYFVSNTIKIKTVNFDNIGKIFTKAQELKMNINNDLLYTVSEQKKEKIIAEHESKLFAKLQEKATRLLGGSGYSLGVPSNLEIGDSNIDYYKPTYYRESLVRNSGQVQTQEASQVSINPPSEYDTKLTISGSFDIVQDVKK
jgi:uncharacterized protein YggE